MKPTTIRQVAHLGATKFVRLDCINNRSEGLGLPANEIEIVANWNIKYKSIMQVIAYKLRRLFS